MISKISHSSLTLALVLFIFLLHVGEKSKFAFLECVMVIFHWQIEGSTTGQVVIVYWGKGSFQKKGQPEEAP